MAFPTVATTNSGSTTTTTSHVLNLPSSVASGNLLIACLMTEDDETHTWPGGWSPLWDSSNFIHFSARYRVADGGEGASITVTSGGATSGAYTTTRITGQHSSTAPEAGTSATGATVPDPPSLTPSWGAEDTLWIAAGAINGAAFTVAPTDYTNLLAVGGSGTPSTATARRELNATSDNPGTFTAEASDDWVANTIAVRPAAAAGSAALTGTATASIIEADVVTGGKTIIATLTGDTYIVNTITPPVIEAADCTISGNNTAEATWAVSHPAASTGDLLIFYIAWDDSTTTTDVTEPAGPNSEVLSEINATPVTDGGTETRAKAWYTIATGSWSASTRTFTPSATESWSATVIRVPAGEFDGTTPIGTINTRTTAGAADTAALSPAMTAGASDGDGRLIWCAGVDADPLTGTVTNWTILQQQDLGAVVHGVAIRNAAVTDNESIAGGDTWTIASDSWTSIGFIVRAPATTPFEAARQAFINGLDSGQAEGTGWDAVVKAGLATSTVVRTSSTVVTCTLSAFASYNITAQETITATIPASILTGASPLVATPTFTVATAGTAALTGTVTASITEADIVTGGKTIILTLTGDTYVAAGTGPIGSTADTTALINGIDSGQAEATGWDTIVKADLITNLATAVVRTSATVCTITLPASAAYNITAQETITATIPAVVLTGAALIVASPTFSVDAAGAGSAVPVIMHHYRQRRGA